MPEVIVNEKNAEWLKLDSLPGVSGKLLALDRDTKAHAYLVNYEPGTDFPRHKHPCLEHVYILEGEVEVEGQRHGPGTHFIFPAGQEHGPFKNESLLTELVVFEGISGLEEAVPEIKTLFEEMGIL
jgi:quercetin dioxygenase-like cupin family protein